MKIKFIFSDQYESALLALRPKNNKATLEWKEINRLEKVLTEFWKKEGKRVEKVLKNITGLSFKDRDILCYLNSQITVSDPLSIRIEDQKDMADNLIHELIHILLSQNYPQIKKGWNKMFQKYKKERFTTKVHIGVHAIHIELAKQLMPHRIRKITSYSRDKAYRRSWDIIERETSREILNIIF